MAGTKKASKLKVLLYALLFCVISGVALGQPTQVACTPGISYWSLLGSVGVDYYGGRLVVNKLYAVCLPPPVRAAASNYAYSPDGGGKLASVVKRANGQVLNTYVWYGENIAGLWELSRYKVLGGEASIQPLTAGDYEIEFQIEDKPFYRFPFRIDTVPADDPYQPAGTRYFLEGPWNDYGNVFFQRNDPKSSLRFTTWVREKAGHESKRSTPYEAKIVRLTDNRVLATDTGTLRLAPHWQQVDILFKSMDGDRNSYFKAEEILSTDGLYRVAVSIDGQPYGNYSFTVKGGKIQLQGRQIREGTDPQLFILDYLYGGRYTSWWIKRD
jgi:hypothetical protein